jgi:GTP cyclohydrolase I
LTYNWFIGKLIDIKINKISETNLRVYSMIARNMLNGIKYEEKKMVFDLILERGADLIDMKQCEWQELCISQESQLPF